MVSTARAACHLATEDSAMKRKSVIWIIVAVALLMVGGYWLRRNLQIDSCLDNGGRWNYQQSSCEFG